MIEFVYEIFFFFFKENLYMKLYNDLQVIFRYSWSMENDIPSSHTYGRVCLLNS